MKIETAQRINSAACAAWLFQHGITPRLALTDIQLLRALSIAQIQTAIDVMDAENASKPSIAGKRPIACTVAAAAVPMLKEYIDSLDVDPSQGL